MGDARYARIYWSVMDDPKFDGIRDDTRLFGAWAMCLIVADMAYPAPAFIPPVVPRPAFARLVACGLVDELGGSRYRIHGLEAERTRRSEAARVGGLASGRSRTNERSLNGRSTVVQQTPNEIEPSKAEQSKAEQNTDARDDLEAFLMVRFHPPTPAQRAFMDGYCRTFDKTGPQRAARLILAHPDDPIGALKQDLADFRAQRAIEAIASEEPRPARREGPSPSVLRSRHNSGLHADSADPACPSCATVGVA